MKFSQVLDKIESSKEFSEFIKKNPKAYLCAGFFVLDFDPTTKEKEAGQLDYALANNRIFTFSIQDNKVMIKEAEKVLKKENYKSKIREINPRLKIEVDELEAVVTKAFSKNKIQGKLGKIIAVLQNFEGKQIWNLTCMIDLFSIVMIHIDSQTGEVLKCERKTCLIS